MSRLKLLFGLLVIAALITAGCTGAKTSITADNLPAAGQSARSDYQKYAGELKDEINYLQNHYRLPENATMDQYSTWLSGLSDRIVLCRQMYNNTTGASDRYLAYLSASSDEYKNVTSENSLLGSEIEALNQSYVKYAEDFSQSSKKMAALDEYRNDLNATSDAYNDLNSFAKDAKVSSESDYASFLDGFYRRSEAYNTTVQNTVDAGNDYLQYLEPGSDEYKAVEVNDKALEDSVSQCRDAYAKYKGDYDSKMGAKAAAQSTFSAYVDKVSKVGQLKKDLDAYRGTAVAMKKLSSSWLDGYKTKIDAFDSACNDAISSGQACEKYLDPSSSDYKSVADNEKNMKDAMATYDGNYGQLEATYKNLHPLDSMK